jgi:hypothetical protein
MNSFKGGVKVFSIRSSPIMRGDERNNISKELHVSRPAYGY